MDGDQKGGTDDLGAMMTELATHVGTAVTDLVAYSMKATEKWCRGGYDLSTWSDDAQKMGKDMLDRSSHSVKLVGDITRSMTGYTS